MHIKYLLIVIAAASFAITEHLKISSKTVSMGRKSHVMLIWTVKIYSFPYEDLASWNVAWINICRFTFSTLHTHVHSGWLSNLKFSKFFVTKVSIECVVRLSEGSLTFWVEEMVSTTIHWNLQSTTICPYCIFASVLSCIRPSDVGPVCGLHQLIPCPLLLINTAPSDHFYSWPPSLQSQLPSPLPFFSAHLAGTGLAQRCPLPSLTHLKRHSVRTHDIQYGLWQFVCLLFPHTAIWEHLYCITQRKAQFSAHRYQQMTSTLKHIMDIYYLFKMLLV